MLRGTVDENGEAIGAGNSAGGAGGLQTGLDASSFDEIGGDLRDNAQFKRHKAAQERAEEEEAAAQHFLPDESEVFGSDEVPVASRLWPWLAARGDLEPLSKTLARRATANAAVAGKNRPRTASVATSATALSDHADSTAAAAANEEVPQLRPSEVAPILAAALAPDPAEFAPERCATGEFVSWPVDEQLDSTATSSSSGWLAPPGTGSAGYRAESSKKGNVYSDGTAPLAGPGDIEKATQAHLKWVMMKDDYLLAPPATTSTSELYNSHGVGSKGSSSASRGKLFPGGLSGKGSGKQLHAGRVESFEAPTQSSADNSIRNEGEERDPEDNSNKRARTIGAVGDHEASLSGQSASVHQEARDIEAPTSNSVAQSKPEVRDEMHGSEHHRASASENSIAARLLAALVQAPSEASSIVAPTSHDTSSVQEDEKEQAAYAPMPPPTETFALEADALRRKCRNFNSKDLRATAELYLAGIVDASAVTKALEKEESEAESNAAAAATAATQRSDNLVGETSPVSVVTTAEAAVTPAWAHGAHLPVDKDHASSSSSCCPQAYVWVPVEAGRSSLNLDVAASSSNSSSSTCKVSVSDAESMTSSRWEHDAELRRLQAARASVVHKNNQRTALLRHRAQHGLVSSSWEALDESSDNGEVQWGRTQPGSLMLEQSEAKAVAEIAREASVLERYSRLAKRQQVMVKGLG